MYCFLSMSLRNSVIGTNPHIFMKISIDQIIKHMPSFIQKLSQISPCFFIFGIFFSVHHLKNNSLAHNCALDCCTSMVCEVVLVFFYCLGYAEIQQLSRCCISQTEDSFNALTCIFQLFCCETVFIAEFSSQLQFDCVIVVLLKVIFDYWLFYVLPLLY